MENISLSDFVVILICALVNGFVFGYWWRDGREPRRLHRQLKNFPKEVHIDHVDPLSDPRPVSRWQLEQTRGMRNIYGTDWHHRSLYDELIDRMIIEQAAHLYGEKKIDDDKPN